MLTFRNAHNWLNEGPEVLAKVFAAARRVLKPGGVFGVVEHRARSYVNANPKDGETLNAHRLPPDLSGPKGEHAKMRAIGESDRMTLKFVTPGR